MTVGSPMELNSTQHRNLGVAITIAAIIFHVVTILLLFGRTAHSDFLTGDAFIYQYSIVQNAKGNLFTLPGYEVHRAYPPDFRLHSDHGSYLADHAIFTDLALAPLYLLYPKAPMPTILYSLLACIGFFVLWRIMYALKVPLVLQLFLGGYYFFSPLSLSEDFSPFIHLGYPEFLSIPLLFAMFASFQHRRYILFGIFTLLFAMVKETNLILAIPVTVFLYFSPGSSNYKGQLRVLLFLLGALVVIDHALLPRLLGTKNHPMFLLGNALTEFSQFSNPFKHIGPMHLARVLSWCGPFFLLCVMRLREVDSRSRMFAAMILGLLVIYLGGSYIRHFAFHNLSIPFAAFFVLFPWLVSRTGSFRLKKWEIAVISIMIVPSFVRNIQHNIKRWDWIRVASASALNQETEEIYKELVGVKKLCYSVPAHRQALFLNHDVVLPIGHPKCLSADVVLVSKIIPDNSPKGIDEGRMFVEPITEIEPVANFLASSKEYSVMRESKNFIIYRRL